MYIYGKNVVTEYLKKSNKVNYSFVTPNFDDKKILSKLNNVKIIEKYEMKKMTDANTQGVLLDIDYNYTSLEEILKKENPLIVILDHLEDPHNLGAIIRTCEAAKVDAIILPVDRSVSVNSTVASTSAGALFNMPIVRVTNLVQTIKKLKKEGFWFIGTDMKGTSFTELDYKGKIGLIIGSEGFGMSRLVEEECDFLATIPMYGNVNSLNASVASAIIVYEAVRQRN